MLTSASRLTVLAALVAALVLVVPGVARAQQAPPDGISVVGDAEAFADNDIGTFRFGVTVRRPTAAAALRAASAVVQRVTGAARATGVARADIQTDVVNVERRRSRRGRTSWIARNAVRVTVRRLSEAGTVVDRVVGAGATSVEGPELGVADVRALYRRTLAQAYADARAKAEALAAQAGMRLGAPIRIRESGAEEFEDALERQAAAMPGDQLAGETGTQVEGGRSRVTATVFVTFAVVAP